MTQELTEIDFEIQKILEDYFPSGASKTFTAKQYILHAIGVFFHSTGQKNWTRCATHPLASLCRALTLCFNSLDDDTKNTIKEHFIVTEQENQPPTFSLL